MCLSFSLYCTSLDYKREIYITLLKNFDVNLKIQSIIRRVLEAIIIGIRAKRDAQHAAA
jgi:hypothetical protein